MQIESKHFKELVKPWQLVNFLLCSLDHNIDGDIDL